MATLFLATPALAIDTYTMDASHCIPVFEFLHLGMTTQSGRFDKVRGKISIDPTHHTGSVHFEIDAASLNMGFGTETPDSPGYELFEVTKYPSISYQAEQLFFDDNARIIAAEGTLTLLGVSKPLTVWVSHFNCSLNPLNKKTMCAANITAMIKRSEFGMLKYIPGISDEIRVSVPVEAYKD